MIDQKYIHRRNCWWTVSKNATALLCYSSRDAPVLSRRCWDDYT